MDISGQSLRILRNFTYVYGTLLMGEYPRAGPSGFAVGSAVREGLQLALIMPTVMVSFNCEPDSSQSYLGSLDEELPTLGWTVGMSVRDCLNEVN